MYINHSLVTITKSKPTTDIILNVHEVPQLGLPVTHITQIKERVRTIQLE